jgi:hypothetical protein
MTQIEESEEKVTQAVKHQTVIYENIKRNQQDELNAYFENIKTMGESKIKNDKLKLYEKEQT